MYLWEAVRNASRDGLAPIKFGIRAHKEDLVSTGLCPRCDHSAKQVDLQSSHLTLMDFDCIPEG